MPVFMILGSVGLVGLFYLWPSWVPLAFGILWGVTFVSFLFQVLFSFLIDPQAARRAWFAGIAFPGLLSLGVMMLAVLTLRTLPDWADWPLPVGGSWGEIGVLVILGWSALSMLAAWCVYRLDRAGAPRWLRNPLLVMVGYGPLLCAISLAAIIGQLRSADLKWDKTVKSGRVKLPT